MPPVLFFGKLSDLSADGPSTPVDSETFRRTLADARPALADPSVRMVVNKAMIDAPVMLRPDDEIAFVPPMSGG